MRAAVEEWAALSGDAQSLLQEHLRREPGAGVARALLVWARAEELEEAQLKASLAEAFEMSKSEGGQAASQVYGVFLCALRQWPLAAEHLLNHFAAYPTDEIAGLMVGAFHASEDAALQRAGEDLVACQYRLAGPESWTWASRLAWVCAEQGRSEEAIAFAEHALGLFPRSGVAVHARAHADHEQGAGRDAVTRVDAWLRENPAAVQVRHLNWHAALASIAFGDFATARTRADTVLRRSDVGMRAAVNWRLLLAGQHPARLSDLTHVRALLSGPGGMAEVFHTFNLALALACESAVEDLHRLAAAARTGARPAYREVLAPVVTALAHVCSGTPQHAIDLLEPLGASLSRLEGVRVEREIVTDTLARALVDTGHHHRAATLLEQRTTTRRHHTYEDLLLAPSPGQPTPLPAQAPSPARAGAGVAGPSRPAPATSRP
ncbi:hypothetical protein [Streptomyces sp. PA5.6]|uniref:hypothetical protein n=1 Tax=Streptomyces sp. PA5.6 TaxID=3035651 RepID=UPI003904A51C